jgi:DNA-binding response OmpR family regulator
MPHRVLVIEDDPTLRLVIQDNLGSEGYQVDVAADGASAVRQAQAATPDLIVLDLTLPDCDGLDLIAILRLRGQIPIIILTARVQQVEKLMGLSLGADDYITKPFDLEELLARIRAVLRRARPSISRIRLGAVTIDFLNKQASRGKHTIPFTHREFELLRYLAERRDIVVHRDELLRAVWGYLDTNLMTRTVDFAIARLRRKIEVDRHHPQFVRTAHGDGYCLSGVSDEDVTNPKAKLSQTGIAATGDNPHRNPASFSRSPWRAR